MEGNKIVDVGSMKQIILVREKIVDTVGTKYRLHIITYN